MLAVALMACEGVFAVLTLAQSGWLEGSLWWSLLISPLAGSLLLPLPWIVGVAGLTLGGVRGGFPCTSPGRGGRSLDRRLIAGNPGWHHRS